MFLKGLIQLDNNGSKLAPLTLKQIENDKKIKDELNRFKELLNKCLNNLKSKLNETSKGKITMDKVECE